MERLCHTNFFYTNRMNKFNCILHYRGHWRKQHERRKNYINSHVQMQIAVNISIDLVNLFVWHTQNTRSQKHKTCKIKCHLSLQIRRLQYMALKSTIPINTDGTEHNMKGSALDQCMCSVKSSPCIRKLFTGSEQTYIRCIHVLSIFWESSCLSCYSYWLHSVAINRATIQLKPRAIPP